MRARPWIALVAVVAIACLAAPRHAQGIVLGSNWDISCQGIESAGGGARLYQYELLNVSGQQLVLTGLVVATDDVNIGNYGNWLMPAGWNVAIGGGGYWQNDGLKTPHGMIAPPPPAADTLGSIVWTAPAPGGVVVNPLGTVLFGFDNDNPSENVDWFATPEVGPGIGANWLAPVAGPAGVFTHGPVHSPVPEPATLALLALGAVTLVRRRR